MTIHEKKLKAATVLGSTTNEKRMEEIYRHFQEDITKISK